jgi:glucose/arabinose dehydrogenase
VLRKSANNKHKKGMPMRLLKSISALALLCGVTLTSQAQTVATTTVITDGLAHPWGVAALPDGQFLVTERPGYITLVTADGKKSRLQNVPDITAERQGGALGLALDPNFASNQTFYACLVTADASGATTSTVFKGRLEGTKFVEPEPIFAAFPHVPTGFHFGCRLAFTDSQSLYVSLGDRGGFKERTQDLTSHFGKVVRITPDGEAHPENPFLESSVPEVFTIGHRNVQGMAVHPKTKQVWTHEHGPKGGDEINPLNKGANYGWPTITYGVNYNGSIITDKTEQEGLEQPLHYWVPSIAPSGMAFYGDDLLVGSLKFRYLNYIDLDANGNVVKETKLLEDLDARIRDVIVHEGAIYVLTDEPNGRLVKVTLN